MIVVVGSRHDPVATRLVASWPRAALCSAEDLVRPGWVWRHSKIESRTWVVDATPVGDKNVTGVFIRRSAVYAEEMLTTHPADRAFLASESHAFLTFVLATTSARVVNPVIDGAFGEEAIRPERWAAAAREVGLSVRSARASSEPRRQSRYRAYEIEVVGGEVFGEGPGRVLGAVRGLANLMGIDWGVFLFDSRHNLITVTCARQPGDAATAALGRLLKAGRP